MAFKLNLIRYIVIIGTIFIVSIVNLFFTSCKKDDNGSPDKSGTVTISVNVQDQSLVGLGRSEGNLQIASFSSDFLIDSSDKARDHRFENFVWSLTPEIESVSSNNKLKSNNLTKKLVAPFASGIASMEIGRKYRILFYEVVGGNEIFRESKEITVSTDRFNLYLAANITYRWYAYSYNDENDIPLPMDVNNPVIETRTDAPFLYDQGEITTNSSTETKIDIQFEHKISKIEIKVDARELFANSFVSLQANFVNLALTTHGFGLKSGSLSGPALSTYNSNDPVVFNTGVSPAVKISTNILYTSTALSNLQVHFSDIQINKSGSNITLISPANPVTADIGGFSLNIEVLRRAIVALKYKGGVIGDYEWAQGILYYDHTDPLNPYKISEPFMVGTTHPCNYYWNWQSLLPRDLTGEDTPYNAVGDPCLEVLPKGSWRTPTIVDFSNLNEAFPANPSNYNGAVYFNANNGEKVYFHEAGWTDDRDCDVDNTNDGLYWSSNPNNTSYAYVLEIDERGGSGLGNEIASYSKDKGMTVKCIRNVK